MERGAESNQRTSDIGPNITWHDDDTIDSSPSTTQYHCPHPTRLTSFTPYITELLLRKAIKHWPTPHHIEYSTYAASLRSYEKFWPVPAAQTPEALSEAGFFFTGKITLYSITNYLFAEELTL